MRAFNITRPSSCYQRVYFIVITCLHFITLYLGVSVREYTKLLRFSAI